MSMHQLQTQMYAVNEGLEAEKTGRAQHMAETSRIVYGIQHELEQEVRRTENSGAQHVELTKRFELFAQEHLSNDAGLKHSLTQLSADVEKLRSSMSQLEASSATTSRVGALDLKQRNDALTKAVRDEIHSQENSLTRLSKEFEVALQSLEAKLASTREESTDGLNIASERSRILEQRCEGIEAEIARFAEAQKDRCRFMKEEVDNCCAMVERIDLDVKASDVVTQTSGSRVEALLERMAAAEADLLQRPRQDFFQPQMESLHRNAQRQEGRLNQTEKEMNARFASEASQREGIKSQILGSVRSCLDKMRPDERANAAAKNLDPVFIDITTEGVGQQSRFQEVHAEGQQAVNNRFQEVPAEEVPAMGKAAHAAHKVAPPPLTIGSATMSAMGSAVGSAVMGMGSAAMPPGMSIVGHDASGKMTPRMQVVRPPGQMVVPPRAFSPIGGRSPASSPPHPAKCVTRQASAPGYASPRPMMHLQVQPSFSPPMQMPSCRSPVKSAGN